MWHDCVYPETFPVLQTGSQLFAHHYGVQVNTMHADWNKLFLGLGTGYVVKYDFQVRACWSTMEQRRQGTHTMRYLIVGTCLQQVGLHCA